MFMQPDDYMILMDLNSKAGDHSLTLDELKMLAGAGLRTVYFHAAIRWDEMQPTPESPMDWSWPDGCVERARAAGLRVLLPCLFTIPAWKPDEFFSSRQHEGQVYDVPNYGSEEVGAEIDDLIGALIERYGGDDVQVVYSIPGNGEFAMNGSPRMEYPMDVFTSWVVDRQRQLKEQHNEVWTAYHPINNPPYFEAVYGALMSAYPFATHCGIIFTYVQHSLPHFHEALRVNRARGMRYYGGVEYVQGLKPNVPKLIRAGMRGIIAPIHMYQPYRRIMPWMLKEIEWALERFAREMNV